MSILWWVDDGLHPGAGCVPDAGQRGDGGVGFEAGAGDTVDAEDDALVVAGAAGRDRVCIAA